MLKGAPIDHIDQVVVDRLNCPLAAPHGGFIFCAQPGDGAYDLHTMFTPEGWGREVALAARCAFGFMFEGGGMQVCHTLEQQDYYRSRPPKSHGWVATSDFAEGSIGSVRSWELTRERWRASPVGRQETDNAHHGRPSRDRRGS